MKSASSILLYYLLLILFSAFTGNSFFITISNCQSSNFAEVLKDSLSVKKGIYMRHYEFRENSPSHPLYFPVKENTRVANFKSNKQYYFDVEDKEILDLFKNVFIWGFCDGENFYVNGQSKISSKPIFDKLLVVGKYCGYYSWSFMTSETSNSDGTRTFRNDIKCVAFDIVSGKKFELTKKVMLELLEPFPDLLQQYKIEPAKNDKLLDYLKMLNKKY